MEAISLVALHPLLLSKSYGPDRAGGGRSLGQHPSWKAPKRQRRLRARGHPRGKQPGSAEQPRPQARSERPGSAVWGAGARGPQQPGLGVDAGAGARGWSGSRCGAAPGTHPCRRRGRRRARPAADRRAPCPARRAGGGRAEPAPAPAATRS